MPDKIDHELKRTDDGCFVHLNLRFWAIAGLYMSTVSSWSHLDTAQVSIRTVCDRASVPVRPLGWLIAESPDEAIDEGDKDFANISLIHDLLGPKQ